MDVVLRRSWLFDAHAQSFLAPHRHRVGRGKHSVLTVPPPDGGTQFISRAFGPMITADPTGAWQYGPAGLMCNNIASVVPGGTGQVTLYVEGIGTSDQWGMNKIHVKVYPDSNPTVLADDEVSYTVVRCVYKICNWRPYTCVRDANGDVAERIVFPQPDLAQYSSPENLLNAYIFGEKGLDDHIVDDVVSHGPGCFMGHTFARLECRLPGGVNTALWIGQTGENNPTEQWNGYKALANGTVWWFRASDGAMNNQEDLAFMYTYYYATDHGPHIRRSFASNDEIKQVAVREFRVSPYAYRLLDEYANSIHDFSGYGLDAIIERTDPQSPIPSVSHARCGCGSFVGLLSTYAGICDISSWKVDYPMPELSLSISTSDWAYITLGFDSVVLYEWFNSPGSFISFIDRIGQTNTSYMAHINNDFVPTNSLKDWVTVTSSPTSAFQRRKMMYSDPALISVWIDNENSQTPQTYTWYKDRGTKVCYTNTTKGDITEWKHADPLYYSTQGGYQP